MAKFTKVGIIAKNKKDPSKLYAKIEHAIPAGVFLSVQKRPTPEQVESNPKLAAKAEKWPEWLTAELVLVENDSE